MAKHPLGSVILQFDKVDFSYGDVNVLRDASFHIHDGEFIGLVGPNGAGKTTILKLILGLTEVSGGSIRLFDLHPKHGREKVGYVPQHASYDPTFPISVEEVVRMGRVRPFKRRYTSLDDVATQEALETMELADLAKRHYSNLSGGQRRRVLVARALSTQPQMLILDEPTSNMDVESEKRLFDALGKLKGKTTILIVTHDPNFVSSLTDRVLCVGSGDFINGRRIVQHPVKALSDAPSELYGGSAAKVLHDDEIDSDYCFQRSSKL